MNLERLSWGEWIAGISALDLLLVTFRAWYKISGGNGKISAWDALSTGRYVVLATAVMGLLLFILVAAEQTEQLSFPFGGLVALVGLGCTVYIAYRMAKPPVDTLDADMGLYFGLASALGVAIGGLISAREAAAPAFVGRDDSSPSAATFTGPTGSSQPPLGALVPDTAGSGTWSPAPATPAPNWTPAAPAPPATAAGAAFGTAAPAGGRPLQVGDDVALTAGGARFPAGTVARVIEVFGGGALVEVTAADGLPERFEVPDEAFERLGSAGAPAAGETWSPAMPAPAEGAAAPAGDDWGFDEDEGAATDTAIDESPSADPATEKVPFWKREIGGKKKRESAAAEAGAASALAAAPIAEAAEELAREERPGLFKRLFGGGKKSEDGAGDAVTETSDEPVPDPAADGGEAASVVDEPASPPEPEVVVDSEPEPEVLVDSQPEPVVIVEPEPEPEPESPAPVPEPEPEPPAPMPEPEPPAREPEVIVEPAPEPEPEPPAPEPEVVVESEPEPPAAEPEVLIDSAPEPEPAAAAEEEPKPRKRSSGSRKVPKEAIADPEPPAPEPEPEVVPEPDVVPEPEVVQASEPEVVPDPQPEVAPEPEVVPDPDPEVVPDREPDPAPAAEEEPKPRKRSSGSRKVPKEALAAAAGADVPPVVGDQVQLKVGGGKYDAGTRGIVVDVFSAGVIVELVADDGRTERLDLPFEAVGPAEA